MRPSSASWLLAIAGTLGGGATWIACASLSGLSGGQPADGGQPRDDAGDASHRSQHTDSSAPHADAHPPADAHREDVASVDAHSAPDSVARDHEAPPDVAVAPDASVGFVQSVETEDFSGATDTQLSAPPLLSVASGDLIVVAVNYTLPGQTTSASASISVADELGSAFHQIDDLFDGMTDSQGGLRTFYASGVKGGINDVVSVNVQPSCTELAIYAAEYSGIASVVGHFSRIQYAAPASADGVTVELTADAGGALVWGISEIATTTPQSSFSAGAGFTARGPAAGSWPSTPGSVFGRAEDGPVHIGSSQVATWTISNSTDTINTVVLFR